MTTLSEYNRKIRDDLVIQQGALQFRTTWGLFSPREIDRGSQMLLDYLDIEPGFDCLDLGRYVGDD